MTKLQQIVKKAQQIRKQYPNKYSKWTDYIKAASKQIAGFEGVTRSGNKTTVKYSRAEKAPAKKKAAAKKAAPAPKKAAPAAKKKAAPAAYQKSLFGVKKTPAKKKETTHKDTKSHNVNIKVVSGTPSVYSVRDRLEKSVQTDINLLAEYQQKLKKVGNKGLAATEYKKSIANIKKMLAHDKKQLREQNKLITQLLK
jgi:hypothetical protein